MTERKAPAVAITNGLWRGVDVLVEPPSMKYAMRHFGDRAAAMIYAAQLASLNGWQLHDRTAASDG